MATNVMYHDYEEDDNDDKVLREHYLRNRR